MAGITNTQIYNELVSFRDETRTQQALQDKQIEANKECIEKVHHTVHGNGEIGMDEMIRDIYAKLIAQDKAREADKQAAKEAEVNKTSTARWWWEKVISPFVMPILIAWAIVQLSL